jgi:sugar lactone lactonase YvrE
MAVLVLLVMLILMALIRRVKVTTKDQVQSEQEHEPGSKSPGDGLSVHATASGLSIGMGDQNRRSNEFASGAPNPSWDRVVGISKFVLFFGLLLLAEMTIKAALGRGWTTFADADGIIPAAVDNEGRVWSINQGEIIHYPDRGAPVRIQLPRVTDPVMSESVISVAFDRQNRLWVQTSNGRLGVEEADHQWNFFSPESLESPMGGMKMLFDVKGQAWTNGAGLSRIELDTEHHIYRLVSEDLGARDALAIDLNEQIWALSAMGELKKLDLDGRWMTITTLEKPDPDVLWAFSSFGPAHLCIDRQGRAWIGEVNGIVHLLETNGVLYTFTPDEPHPAIYGSMVVDYEGNIWGVSGYQGLYRFNTETGWTAYNSRNSGLTDPFPIAMTVDGQGRVWFGSNSAGLTRMDPSAGLPAKYVPLLGNLGTIAIPAGLISILSAGVAAILPSRPGRKPDWKKTVICVFSAASCGLYVLAQRDRFAEQIMLAVFGDGWSYADGLVMLIAPTLGICLIPLCAAIGAVLGILIFRWFALIRSRP